VCRRFARKLTGKQTKMRIEIRMEGMGRQTKM
jgi:hypothetical protein